MKKATIATLAVIGGFIGGFVVSEVIIMIGYTMFGSVKGIGFLSTLLPFAGAGAAWMIVMNVQKERSHSTVESNRVKSGRVPVSRYVYLGLSWGLVACIVIQVFIAGLAVFGEPSHWHSHVVFVHLFEYLPLLMLLFAFIGKLPSGPKWQSFGLFLLVFLQYLTANLPGAGALHPVIAVALFWLSLSVARRAGGYCAKSAETSASR